MVRRVRKQRDEQGEAEGEVAERSVAGAAFWALMDRWSVADDVALSLIGAPLARKPGSRPRFRLQGTQVETYELLRALDRHLEDLHGASRAWLSQPQRGAPFAGGTPLRFMAEGGPDAIAQVLRTLEREAFKASLQRSLKR